MCSFASRRQKKEYASEVAQKLWDLGLFTDVDNSDNTLPKKIRNGEIAQYNFILGELYAVSMISWLVLIVVKVVGENELQERAVNVRNRDDAGTKNQGAMVPLDDIAEKLVRLKACKSLLNKLD